MHSHIHWSLRSNFFITKIRFDPILKTAWFVFPTINLSFVRYEFALAVQLQSCLGCLWKGFDVRMIVRWKHIEKFDAGHGSELPKAASTFLFLILIHEFFMIQLIISNENSKPIICENLSKKITHPVKVPKNPFKTIVHESNPVHHWHILWKGIPRLC